jgi:hypothetical protein
MNNPWVDNGNGNGNELLRSVYNTVTENTGKPENHYLTNHYKECSSAKLIVDTEFLHDREYDWLSHYQFDTLPDKEFMVQSITYNVKNSIEELTLKQIYNVAAPVISHEWEAFTITSSTPDTTIYYTTDGSTPDETSQKYVTKFGLNNSTTIKAVATKNGEDSRVTTFDFVIPERPQLTVEMNIDYENAIVTITGDLSLFQDG